MEYFYLFRCITDPMGKRWSNTQASMVVLATWLYASPAALLPYFEVWGRYVPGNKSTKLTFLRFFFLLVL